MSAELDRLLERMNTLLAGRQESDLGMGDAYWSAKAEYQRALGAANGVHIPVTPNTGVSTLSAGTVAVKQAAAKHAEDLATTGRALGEAEAKLMIAKAEVAEAQSKLDESKKPIEDRKTPLELELEAKQRALEVAEKEVEVKRESHEQLKDNPPDVDVVFKEAAEKAAPSPDTSTHVEVARSSEESRNDMNVIQSSGTAQTTTVNNPLSGQQLPAGSPQPGIQQPAGSSNPETDAERQLREAGIS